MTTTNDAWGPGDKSWFYLVSQAKLPETEHALCKIKDTNTAAWGVDDTQSFK